MFHPNGLQKVSNFQRKLKMEIKIKTGVLNTGLISVEIQPQSHLMCFYFSAVPVKLAVKRQ